MSMHNIPVSAICNVTHIVIAYCRDNWQLQTWQITLDEVDESLTSVDGGGYGWGVGEGIGVTFSNSRGCTGLTAAVVVLAWLDCWGPALADEDVLTGIGWAKWIVTPK